MWAFASAALSFPLQHWITRERGGRPRGRRPRLARRRSAVSWSPSPSWSAWSPGCCATTSSTATTRGSRCSSCSSCWPAQRSGVTARAASPAAAGSLPSRGAWSPRTACAASSSAACCWPTSRDPEVHGLALVAGGLVAVWPSAWRFTRGVARSGAFAFLGGAATGQTVAQVVLTGGPVLLALLGGSPMEVTALFAALALFRAPYQVALGMLPQLTERVTTYVVSDAVERLRALARGLAVVTVVAVPLAGLFGAVLGPWLLRLVFGSTVDVGAEVAAVVAAGQHAGRRQRGPDGRRPRRRASAPGRGCVGAGGPRRGRRRGGPGRSRRRCRARRPSSSPPRSSPRSRSRSWRPPLAQARSDRRGLDRDQQHRRAVGQVAAAQHPRVRPAQPHQHAVGALGDLGEPGVARRRGREASAEALGDEEREDPAEGVRRPHDLHPAALDQPDQLGSRVAPVVSGLDVVVAPRPLVGRHGQQHPAARREHPGQLGDGETVVGAVLDDVEGRHHVEGLVAERQLGRRPADTLTGHEPLGQEVEADVLLLTAHPAHARCVRAADVEGASRGAEVRPHHDAEQVGARPVPPVALGAQRGRARLQRSCGAHRLSSVSVVASTKVDTTRSRSLPVRLFQNGSRSRRSEMSRETGHSVSRTAKLRPASEASSGW